MHHATTAARQWRLTIEVVTTRGDRFDTVELGFVGDCRQIGEHVWSTIEPALRSSGWRIVGWHAIELVAVTA